MTERDRWDLRGPVRACQLRRIWYSRRCEANACNTAEHADTTTLDFRADGTIARHCHRNYDGSEWTTTYDYDDNGRLRSAQTENADRLASLQLCGYDAAGRLSRVVERFDGKDDRIIESYEYDASGNKTKTFYIDVAEQRPDTHYGWGAEGSDCSYSARGTAMLKTLYNGTSQPSGLYFYDLAGRQLSRVEFRYDEAGHLIEETQIHNQDWLTREILESLNQAQREAMRELFGAGQAANRRTHVYDENGRRVETRSVMGPFLTDMKTTVYNDYGDRILEISEINNREYGMDDAGSFSAIPKNESVIRSEARFLYEYDAHHNWIRKTVEGRAEMDSEFTLSSTELRTISYFKSEQVE